MNMLAAIESPEQFAREPLRVEDERRVAETLPSTRSIIASRSTLQLGLRANSEVGMRSASITARVARLQLGQALVARRDDQVAADQRVRFARGDPGRMQRFGRPRDPHMRADRAVLLAEARQIEIGAEEPVEIGGDRKRLAHRHDARAADPGDEHAVALAHFRQNRLGNRRQVERARRSRACAPPRRGPSRSSGRTPRRR